MSGKDYSSTPLWKKLGIKEGVRVCFMGSPDGFAMTLPKGVRIFRRLVGRFDVVLLFATREADLNRRFRVAKSYVSPAGGVWIAYPKKASDIRTNLTFESVQRVGLEAGLVDNKSCAINSDWSGVRFVYRLKDR